MRVGDNRLPDRFWDRVIVEGDTGCWAWAGSRYTNGYGRMSYGGRERLLHRFVYERLIGPIPDGLVIDHLCRTRFCVNPAHLEPVTHLENVHRWSSTITHCPQGHEFTPENTRIKATRLKPDGITRYMGRDCRECDRIRQAAKRAARKAA